MAFSDTNSLGIKIHSPAELAQLSKIANEGTDLNKFNKAFEQTIEKEKKEEIKFLQSMVTSANEKIRKIEDKISFYETNIDKLSDVHKINEYMETILELEKAIDSKSNEKKELEDEIAQLKL